MTGGRTALALLVMLSGCGDGGGGNAGAAAPTVPVRIAGSGGTHVFRAEVARTVAEQNHGLMFRTDLVADSAMLFAPYPPDGGEPRETSFWMKDTPTPLDILFIRPDGTIARIAENTVPFSEAPVPSGEPVSAVLEIRGGRAAELGIGEGDRVTWPESGPIPASPGAATGSQRGG